MGQCRRLQSGRRPYGRRCLQTYSARRRPAGCRARGEGTRESTYRLCHGRLLRRPAELSKVHLLDTLRGRDTAACKNVVVDRPMVLPHSGAMSGSGNSKCKLASHATISPGCVAGGRSCRSQRSRRSWRGAISSPCLLRLRWFRWCHLQCCSSTQCGGSVGLGMVKAGPGRVPLQRSPGTPNNIERAESLMAPFEHRATRTQRIILQRQI